MRVAFALALLVLEWTVQIVREGVAGLAVPIVEGDDDVAAVGFRVVLDGPSMAPDFNNARCIHGSL
jgi:hypothetical protein